jgi:hypothetical protein
MHFIFNLITCFLQLMKQILRTTFFRLGRGLLSSLWLVLLPLLGWGQVVISQVYTGGGVSTGSPAFNQDYVELFNRSATAQAIGGFTIQYAASTGATYTVSAAIPAGTNIPVGGYYLIGLTSGSAGSALVPAPNFTSPSIALTTASGKVALVSNTTALSGANPATGATVIDFVGYGTAATGYEGNGPTGTALTLTTAAFRTSSGCTDINQNAFDFAVAAPAPRNAATTAAPCLPPATITTQDPTPAAICATGTSTLAVPYTITAGNAAGTYLVQLSSASGSFAAPTILATASTASPLAVTIPATVAGGTGYLVRAVIGSNIASANPTPFTINNVAVTPTADQALPTNSSGTTLTATETPAGTSRQWYYSTTSGSGYTSAISGATGTTYTPAFAVAGTYYVVVQTTFGTCSVTSNEVKVTATAPTITTGTVAAGPYCVGQGAPAAVSIPFTVSSAFAPGNVFTAYLSYNSFGSNKLAIGTLSGTGSGTIVGSIAQTTGLLTRTDYRIRVEASSPAAGTLTDNGTNLSVASYLDNEVTAANSVAGNARATLNFTGPATCVTNVIVTIKAGSTAGTKPVAGGTYAPGAGGGTVAFGTGTVLSSGQYVVYNGPATGSITVTGLTNGTRYIFGTFTTNGGATGTTGYSDGSTASVIPVVPASLTEVLVPQFLSGHAAGSSTHPTRLPYVWRVSLGNLAPITTYKYYTAVRAATDAANNDGAGIPIETQTAGAFVRKSGPSLTNSSSTFTTDANGSYTGWFGLEPSPDVRYNDQAVVYPLVVLNGGDGLNVATQFLATTSSVTALNLGSAATGATGVRGSSFGAAGNLVLTYDNAAGTGRPLAGTWVENDGSVNTSSYAGFYGSVEAVAGAYGLLTPNANTNGIRRVEQRALTDGSLIGCAATSATGTWAGGAATASPSGGTTALVLTNGDTPFATPTLASLSTSAIRPGQTITLTGTGFAATPTATVVFTPGSTVVATSVGAGGTSLTVVVPSGAGAGTVSVRNGCGLSNTLATSLAPASAPGVLLFEDDFDYAASQPLASNGWSPVAGTAGSIATTTGNLLLTMYPQGAALSSLPATISTRAALVAGVDGPLYRGGARPASATALYAAAVVNFSDTQATSEYFLAFTNAASASTGSPAYRSQVYATRASATTFTFELALAGRPSTTSTTQFNLNTNYLLVLKTETTTTGAETTSLYILPAGADFSTEPTTPLLSMAGTTPLAVPLNAVVLRQNGASNATLTLDGIRLATGWGAAVGQPYYTAAAATINAGSYYSLTVANADVLTPSGSVKVENSLNLTSGIIASTAANSLTLYPGTSVAGGSATSYVSGPLVRVTGPGAATTVFPIGSGANYRPLVLTATAQTGPATYTATQIEGNAGQSFSTSNGLGTAPLTRVSTQRTYTITTNNPNSGFTGTITLPFEPNDYVNNPADAGLVIAKRDAVATNSADNGKWTNLGNSGSTGTGTGPGGAAVSGSLTSALFSGFSDFTLGATNDISNSNVFNVVNPLPVQLTSFGATRGASGVQVTWATTSEQNSDYFVIERSLDGRTFAGFTRTAAHGTTAQAHPYASLDAAAPAALLYYRLRQVDLDGTVAFSPVVTVAALGGAAAELALAPNPARESISFLTAAPTAYSVRNPLGQLVRSGTTASGTNTLLINELPAGVYFFELHSAAGRVVRKFVKE